MVDAYTKQLRIDKIWLADREIQLAVHEIPNN